LAGRARLLVDGHAQAAPTALAALTAMRNGQPALETAGLTEEFRKLILRGRQAMRLLDRDGNMLLNVPDPTTEHADGGAGANPEVQRGELRQMLLDSLPAGTIRWSHQVSGVRALGDGRHEVTFSNGATATATASLLVGADGAWSRVRPLLSGATPEYTGISFVETHLFDGDNRHPTSATTVGGGAMMVLEPGKGILAHRERGGNLHTWVMLSRPRDWFAAIDFADAATATARILWEFDGWAPRLTALIADGETAPVLRAIYTLPIEHRWDRTPGVTLIGDAAHPTAPNGEGANLALYDGAELGTLIAGHPDDIETALAEYEQAMFARSAASNAGPADLQLMLGDGTPHNLINTLTGS
jgi:2-polyprenyl-6-methoxyphenol hydroxylase-like FAD-dependent oxidoreductase